MQERRTAFIAICIVARWLRIHVHALVREVDLLRQEEFPVRIEPKRRHIHHPLHLSISLATGVHVLRVYETAIMLAMLAGHSASVAADYLSLVRS